MRKMFQKEWHGIPFASFRRLSDTELAGPEFYQNFYDEFFRRYQSWDELSPAWLIGKSLCADFILNRIISRSMVLSIGCGLGAIEHYLKKRGPPGMALYINEVAPLALRWIESEFPGDRRLIGTVPVLSGIPGLVKFDLVYLVAVDYSMDQKELTSLLEAIRPLLSDTGGCLLISASFEDVPETIGQLVVNLARKFKRAGEESLCRMRLRSRGQFWGWIRSRGEYQAAMAAAGYSRIEDGFIDPTTRSLYWVYAS